MILFYTIKLKVRGGDLATDLSARDGNLIEHWYIACLERELPRHKPIKRVIYDQPLVLFRSKTGEVVCLPDRCLHRHAQLSLGDIVDGKLGCPYHGWLYDETGTVVGVPSEGPRFDKDNPRRCLRPRKTHVQDGCVWVWMGKGEATIAPPYRFPSFHAPSYRKYFMITDFDNEVTHLAENFMDVPHTVFVHAGWFRTRSKKEVPIKLEVENGQVLVTYQQEQDEIGFWGRLLNPSGEGMMHTDRFIMPNITRVDYRFGNSTGFIISSQITPVSTLKSRVYTEIAYDLGFLNIPFHPILRFYTRQVIEQDVDIMKNQGDNFKIDLSTDFNHTEADMIHQAIEELRELGMAEVNTYQKPQYEKQGVIWI
jgi:phenylpropionate dioxygenase-like ring-hydroxylating dioxygenase large terminal subunit